ncbi:MAG: acyl-CoA dehydrogenase family protein [Acidimicrobiales bacterium]|nr:acyl-CoA dehydrogenase [Acidimicrobiaceae bacterium]MBA4812902.1 acyl-CoA dehydrogenase family protein [Acidimicrobiales bacterium]RPH18314.1 MAG: acyl-CoA dehydrogenase [Actinobacteria bacterium TMED270]HBQ04948.1 acyl-CoA dehydrogenase [Acidimicrobiaceae bacterium]HCJ86491.1 acyl-CoA dehydrogenase [Acidimicrobiaceae bacterium]|tara:strand:+ start:1571 stop:2752 length:1182 start_codon:yes stop_codon:yes gene_type:complete
MVDQLPEELRALKTRMKTFINDVVIPCEPELMNEDANSERVAAELKTKAKESGLWALGHPVEIGGGGLPFMDFVYLNEVIGRSHWGQWAVGSLSMQDSIMLHLYANEDQRERFLAPLVAGEIYPSVGLTEPEVAGSDPTQMQATAVLDGDEWVINGHKWFTSGANRAAFTTVFAITEADAEKHNKFSSIIVPTDTEGYEIVRVVPTMGHTGGNHCEVQYNDVRVPYENLLGGRGQGFHIAQKRLGPGRIFHSMRWLGQAQRAFELMCERAKMRYAHGSYLAEKGDIQAMIAESAAEIQAARMMTLDAARAIDSGSEARTEISLIKFWGARMLHNVVDRAIQVHGAMGVTSDTPLEFMYREARYARLYDGPDEVHRMVVARRLVRDPYEGVPWA